MRDFGFYIYKTLYTLPEKPEEVKEKSVEKTEKKEDKKDDKDKKEDKKDDREKKIEDRRDSRRRDRRVSGVGTLYNNPGPLFGRCFGTAQTSGYNYDIG